MVSEGQLWGSSRHRSWSTLLRAHQTCTREKKRETERQRMEWFKETLSDMAPSVRPNLLNLPGEC